ncbi:MAG: TolC family protein [Cytophagales bacterium]|nr:TolC family protein [Cytophagales bacterium]
MGLKIIVKAIVPCFFFSSFIFGGFAQDSGQAEKQSAIELDLQEVIRFTVEKNWDILISQQNIQHNKSQLTQAFGKIYPSLLFSSNFTQQIDPETVTLAPFTRDNPTAQSFTYQVFPERSFWGTVQASQVVLDLQAFSALKRFKTQLSASRTDLLLQVRQSIRDASVAYYQVLLNRLLWKSNEENAAFARKNLEDVNNQFRAGTSSRYDLLRAKVSLSNSLAQELSSKINLENAVRELKVAAGIPLEQGVTVSGKLDEKIPKRLELNEAGELVGNSLSLRRIDWQRKLAMQDLKISFASLYPTLSSLLSFERKFDKTSQETGGLPAGVKYNFYVGISLNYTLFNGFQRREEIRQAKIMIKQAELQLKAQTQSLGNELRKAVLAVNRGVDQIETQQESLDLAEQALQIARERYRAGTGTLLEILDTQSALLLTRTQYAQAYFQYLSARATYEFITATN